MRALRIILMTLAFISLPAHAKDKTKRPTAATPSTTAKAAKPVPANTTASTDSTDNNSGAAYDSGRAFSSCAQLFIMPEPYNWYAYRNICSEAIHITFRQKAVPMGSRTSAMDLAPGQSNITGYSTSDTPQGLLAGVCHKDFVPVDTQNKMWEAVEGMSFRCMKISGTAPSASATAAPQKNANDRLPPLQGSAVAQDRQKIDSLKEAAQVAPVGQEQRQAGKPQPQEVKRQQPEAERQARGANTENGNNTAATAGEKPLIPQPAPNAFEIEKIKKGFVVALDCGKNVKGALQVVAEIGDPPNAVVLKNASSGDIFLVAGAKRVDGYGSEALVLRPGKEHKIVQLKVDRNYNYGEWYAVYSDRFATQPVERNSEKPSADQVRCLNRMNEILKSFW